MGAPVTDKSLEEMAEAPAEIKQEEPKLNEEAKMEEEVK